MAGFLLLGTLLVTPLSTRAERKYTDTPMRDGTKGRKDFNLSLSGQLMRCASDELGRRLHRRRIPALESQGRSVFREIRQGRAQECQDCRVRHMSGSRDQARTILAGKRCLVLNARRTIVGKRQPISRRHSDWRLVGRKHQMIARARWRLMVRNGRQVVLRSPKNIFFDGVSRPTALRAENHQSCR